MRIGCVVPFCKRTRGDRKGDPVRAGMEWICAQHWRHVSKATKRRKRLAERIEARAMRRFEATYRAQGNRYTGLQWTVVVRARELAGRAWTRCKTEAIEASAGIG